LEFDAPRGQLFWGPTRVPLSDAQAAILVQLVSHAGEVVSKRTFESTRVDIVGDVAGLTLAIDHASRGCELAPAWADAWSTLAFVPGGEHPLDRLIRSEICFTN
jgi:hypothetical protein